LTRAVEGVDVGMGALYEEEWVCGWPQVDGIVHALKAADVCVERVVEKGDEHAKTGMPGRQVLEAVEALDLKPGEYLRHLLHEAPPKAGAGKRSRAMVMLLFSRNLQDEAEVVLLASRPRRLNDPARVDEAALAGQASLTDRVLRVLQAAGAREVSRPQPRQPPVTYVDAHGRYGMKYETVALLSLSAGGLVGHLLWWTGWLLGAPRTMDECWLAGMAVLVLTWVWLGRRPSGGKS